MTPTFTSEGIHVKESERLRSVPGPTEYFFTTKVIKRDLVFWGDEEAEDTFIPARQFVPLRKMMREASKQKLMEDLRKD